MGVEIAGGLSDVDKGQIGDIFKQISHVSKLRERVPIIPNVPGELS